MKKKFLLSTVTLLAGLLAGSTCLAQIEAESLTFSPMIGGYVFEGNQNVDDDAAIGLAFGYNFTENWGAEGSFRFINTEEDLSGSNDDIDGRLYHLDALYHFMPDSKLVPYVAAGLGGITLDDNPDGNNTNPLFNYGGGVKYFLNKNTALRGDIRHIVTFDDHFNNMVYGVGLTFQFPTKAEIVPAAAPPPPIPKPVPVVKEIPKPAPKPVPPPVPIMEEVSVTLHIEFDFDKDSIRSIYDSDCRRVAKFLNDYPDVIIEVDGHTDSRGSEKYNMDLSLRRAENARNYLVKNYNIDPARIKARGFGESRPIASNATVEGRQRNRRVVAVVKTIVEKK